VEAARITTMHELVKAKSDWNNLLEGSISNTVFLTWEWMYSWAECFINGNRKLFVIFVYDDRNRLVGIAPWYIDKINIGPTTFRQINFLGNPETASDYLDVFTEKGKEKEVAIFLYEYLYGQMSKIWDCINFQDIMAESLFLLNFTHKHRLQGKHFEIHHGSFCPLIFLPKAEGDFLTTISPGRSKRFRQDLRTLRKTNLVEIKTIQNDDIEVAVDSFFKLYAEKTEWSGSDLQKFIKQVLINSENRSYIQVDFLLANDNCIAGMLHLKYRNTLSLYLMAVDKKYNPRISVGNLLVGLCIGRAIEASLEVYDFLKGYEEYKFYWTSGGRTANNMFTAQSRVGPVLYVLKQMSKNALKTILR
jgi:hypothetical protein